MTEMITALIVDDISSARDNLRQTIQDFLPEINIIGEADGVVSGAKAVKKLTPQIVFLDIEMPDGSGFDLIDLLPEGSDVKIIFTTASDAYAIKAFRYAAVDYLLKPIDPDDLQSAVDKAISRGTAVDILKSVFHSQEDGDTPKRIALHTSDEVILVDVADIVRCQSMDNYCHIFLTSGKKILMSKPLKHFADLLHASDFIRVHQSHLINFEHIHSYVKREGGYLLLKDSSHVPVSMRRRAALLERLAQ